ncbi:MAG TPA: alpha/beta fold hydrolase [Bryobacteraceae bacterium]|nr:alpha/beta fold hydrolase [Bryobacteraceae bacterium]
MGRALCALASLLMVACTRTSTATAPSIREEQVQFRNGDVTLAGTLFIPTKPGRYPAVVLFHGSGPQARYPERARWFAEQGMAALTYDKRGMGESTGDFRKVSFLELSSDGIAGVELLKSRTDIDPKRIGVWGLSQGGWLGPLAASQSNDVAFVIAVSGPGVSPGEQMVYYYACELRAQGVPEAQIEEASALRRDVWSYVSTGARFDEAKKEVARARSRPWYKQVAAQRDTIFDSFQNASTLKNRAWFKSEVNYDPVLALRKLTVPALFFFGDADQLVPVPKSVDVIRRTLTESGHRDFTIQVFPGADHVMNLASENGQEIPAYRETMKSWLATHHFIFEKANR